MLSSTIVRSCRLSCRLSVRSFSSNNDEGNSKQPAQSKVVAEHKESDKSDDKQAKAQAKLSNLLSSLYKKQESPSADSDVTNKIEKIQLSRPSRRPKDLEDDDEQRDPTLRKQFKEVGDQMAKAVKSVAKVVGGGTSTESELLKSLKSLTESSGDVTVNTPQLRDVLSGIKVEKSVKKTRDTKIGSATSRFIIKETVKEKVDLFGADPLGIFSTSPREGESPSTVSTPTWDALVSHNLKMSVTNSPANHFQELMQWTEQGKVWSFPIDNEVGLHEEKKVGFHEHVFLEHHLRPWCPPSGPIRHFMELVCVGLSKNPHITVERKKRVIAWYRDFFDEKRSILEEVGAYPAAAASSSATRPREPSSPPPAQ